jgi:hypothetical protein
MFPTHRADLELGYWVVPSAVPVQEQSQHLICYASLCEVMYDYV